MRFPGFTEPWRRIRLGKIATFSKGAGISKDQRNENGKPCILYGELYTTYTATNITNVISRTNLPEDSLIKSVANDVIIPSSGETAEDIATARCVLKNDVFLGGDLNIIRLNNDSGSFLCYQLNGVRKREIAKLAQGVSVVHLYKESLKSLVVSIPSIDEQSKIAYFLQLLDERIATQRRLIEDFISLRRALLQNAISRGLSKKSWKLTSLSDILTERGEKNSAGYNVCSVSVSEGVVNQIEYLGRSFAAKETGHYNVARYGDIIYTKSPTGSFPYGIVKRNTQKLPAAISPLYGVFVPKYDWIGILLGYYFESEVNTFNYLHPIIQKGAKNTINITNSGFLANSVPLPTDESEALTLAKCLDTISDKIILEKSILTHYTEQREYLLSKMFV
ncbi:MULTISPECIES: restriction endonuclease subunit S [Muribaculaceae]|uniref:restriction endonuclease subunit S n=2 Tax=Bacteroidales TaxID=171549 RepID=UPI0025B1CE03|nr:MULTISPECIES: restriction endonuclease subunit S [Muribaculaceae]